jgi:hypothetical protein
VTTSSQSSLFATQTEQRGYPAVVRKVILEQPPTPATGDLVATNIVAVIVGTARLVFYAAAIALLFFFAVIGGFVKANNRGRRKSW